MRARWLALAPPVAAAWAIGRGRRVLVDAALKALGSLGVDPQQARATPQPRAAEISLHTTRKAAPHKRNRGSVPGGTQL